MSGIPLDTEILTRDGWKSFNHYIAGELRLGEEIFSYDINTGETEWVPLSAVIYHGEVPLYTITSDNGYVLTAGEKHPWVMEYSNIKGHIRQIRLATTRKLTQLDKTRRDDTRVAKHSTIDSKYVLLVGEKNAGVTEGGLSNISVLSGDLFLVTPGGVGLTWTPINSNNSLLIRQNHQIVVTGTYSKIPPGGTAPLNNEEPLAVPINYDNLVSGRSIILDNIRGFTPLLDETITGFIIETLPTVDQGELTFLGNPVNVGDVIPIDQVQHLNFNSDPNFRGTVIIEYRAIDSLGQQSIDPSFIYIPVIAEDNNDVLDQILNRVQEVINLIGNTLLVQISDRIQQIIDLIGDINTPNTILSLLNRDNDQATISITNYNNVGNTTNGAKMLEFEVETGPITILGITYNTGDIKRFPYREGGYNSITFDSTGGSLNITEVI